MRPTLFRLASDTEDNDEALGENLMFPYSVIEKFGHTHILKNIGAGLIKNTGIEQEGPHTVRT
jgi:hypothetical protein